MLETADGQGIVAQRALDQEVACSWRKAAASIEKPTPAIENMPGALPPPERRGHVSQNRFDDMGIVVNAELVGDGQ